MQIELAKLPPPPRLMTAFTAGFDAIANHIVIIALPVLVDLFLWLGPHLNMKALLLPILDRLQSFSAPNTQVSAADLAAAQQVWTQYLSRFNLFSFLRTYPVGSTSLMSVRMPVETPLGLPITLQPASLFTAFGWALLVILVGWAVGSLYFHVISGAALGLPSRSLLPSMLQVALLSTFWFAVLCALGFPTLVLLSFLNLVSPVIAQGALILLAVIALWLVLPVFFSPHGIFAARLNVVMAIRTSLKMIRYTLPTSGLFLLGFLIISQGMDFLWRTPLETSWWTVIGIAGHAFISSALLAASFVYYRDVNVWLAAILDQLKRGQSATAKV